MGLQAQIFSHKLSHGIFLHVEALGDHGHELAGVGRNFFLSGVNDSLSLHG